jgi:two-component system sensor histidine kinase UhpB
MAQKKTALQTLELQLREAQSLAPFASFEWDVRTDRVMWSEELYRMFGVDPKNLQPSVEAFLSLVHPEDRERVAHAAEDTREAGTPYALPIRIVRPDGGVRTLRCGSHAVTDAAGRPLRIVGVLLDISDQTAAQDGLRDYAEHVLFLARRLVEVQEAERRHIANELHDRLGPTMTALSINLQLIEEALPAPLRRALTDRLADSREQVRDASVAMRDVMGELRPPELDGHGLPAALRSLAAAFEKRTAIRVALTVSAPERAANGLELPLYRIAQEALNNVAKHSRAAGVQIRYAAGAGRAALEVEDDGVGFEESAPPAGSGWGLVTMRERAAAVGASCEIVSHPGRGVLVRVTVER